MAIVAGSIKPRFAVRAARGSDRCGGDWATKVSLFAGILFIRDCWRGDMGGFWIFAMRRKDRAPLGIVGWGVVVMLQMLAKRIFFGPKAPVSDNHAVGIHGHRSNDRDRCRFVLFQKSNAG